MKDTKTFIYNADKLYYFKKEITLEKQAVRTTSIHFDLEASKGLTKSKQKRNIKKAMKKLINNSDVIMASSDFAVGDTIITSQGIIIGDIPASIFSKAEFKQDQRINDISANFINDAYVDSKERVYEQNFDLIDLTYLDLCKNLLTSDIQLDNDVYLTLLDCLIEVAQPIKSDSYESNRSTIETNYQKYLSKVKTNSQEY